MTKGPLALFYGGEEIIPHVSDDSSNAYNTPFMIIILLSIVLQVFLTLFKKFKIRAEITYEQQLKMAVMSGVRNVYGQLVFFLGLLGFLGSGLFHYYSLHDNTDTFTPEELSKKNHFVRMVGFVFIFSLMIFHPFARNPKLRYCKMYLRYF